MFFVPFNIRPRPILTTLLLTAVAVGHLAVARTATTSAHPIAVPTDVRALVAPNDTVLAYKVADLFGDGHKAAVMVVRHKVVGKSNYDFDSNPCDLVVLHQQNGTFAEADRSTKAVDCTYNDVARNAPAMSLNDNLAVTPARIVYVNQKDKGDSTFCFAWSKAKGIWYLQSATASNPDGDNVKKVSASYPQDFSWTPMASVDPEAMAEILEKKGSTSSKRR